MTTYHVSASGTVNAPPQHVYAILADYQDGHQRIVPKPEFREMVIEKGGHGAGTIVRVKVTLLGISKTIRAAITEPEPGRVLAESDLAGNFVTTFTVEPTENGKACTVTITSDLKSRWGFLERFFTRRTLLSMFRRELRNLATVAETQVKQPG